MNDTRTYQASLEEEKKKLEEELTTVGRPNPSNPQDWEPTQDVPAQDADILDRAANLDTYQENSAILTDLEIRLGDVRDALGRIESGSYGTCEIGNETIESERLDADPAARTCIAHMNG